MAVVLFVKTIFTCHGGYGFAKEKRASAGSAFRNQGEPCLLHESFVLS